MRTIRPRWIPREQVLSSPRHNFAWAVSGAALREGDPWLRFAGKAPWPGGSKPYEQRLAVPVRLLGSESEGEVLDAWRLEASPGVAERRLHRSRERDREISDGRSRRRPDAAPLPRRLPGGARGSDAQADRGGSCLSACVRTELRIGKRIALYCQSEKGRLKEDRHRQFVDDMASRMTWSCEPTPKQATYLLSLFRQLGGRVK